jgi:hypothetical protein
LEPLTNVTSVMWPMLIVVLYRAWLALRKPDY